MHVPFLVRCPVAGTDFVHGCPAQPQGVAPPQGVTQVTSVEGITEYRLANGLQMLLVPDESKPTTTVNVTYRARKFKRPRGRL